MNRHTMKSKESQKTHLETSNMKTQRYKIFEMQNICSQIKDVNNTRLPQEANTTPNT